MRFLRSWRRLVCFTYRNEHGQRRLFVGRMGQYERELYKPNHVPGEYV
jgi:hypothetical protein